MRSALKDTTQRYKSLTGFAIYAITCDISSMRYALRGVKGIYIISQATAREVILLLSVACMASRENISHLRKQIYRHKKELLCPQKQCLQRKEDEEFYSSSSFFSLQHRCSVRVEQGQLFKINDVLTVLCIPLGKHGHHANDLAARGTYQTAQRGK